ncbi:MAG: pyridoxamine 5'-phosphate oxidase family protein [Nitrospiria bacterium]
MTNGDQHITHELAAWLRAQRMFFVATAPLAGDGHVNCSPKGGDTFRVLDATTVAYQDLTGSGAETIAHVRENGRIVLMFCAFDGPPKIVRLHGTGEVILSDHQDFTSLIGLFPANPGTRTVIRVIVSRVSSSCGFGIPLLDYQGERGVLDIWAEKKGADQLRSYRRTKNARSIDGLPALDEP